MNFSNMHTFENRNVYSIQPLMSQSSIYDQAREVPVNHASKGNVPHSIQQKGTGLGGKTTVFKLETLMINDT